MTEHAGVVEEGSLPTEPRPETTDRTTIAKLLFAMTGLYERWRNELMEARRYQDPRDRDPDYEARLRRLEGDLGREEPTLRMGDYHEGGREPSWRDWMLNILGGLIVVGIGAVIYQLEELKSQMSASLARQEMDEKRLDRVEQRVYRGAESPP
jgi:hypothetical protein